MRHRRRQELQEKWSSHQRPAGRGDGGGTRRQVPVPSPAGCQPVAHPLHCIHTPGATQLQNDCLPSQLALQIAQPGTALPQGQQPPRLSV